MMDHQKIVLSNGLTVLYYQKLHGAKIFDLSINFAVGSRNESVKNQGISHLLEHCVYLGTRNNPSREEIERALLRLGGDYNAFTGKVQTSYTFSGRDVKLEDALRLMFDITLTPRLNGGKDFIKEKQVVIAEIDELLDENGKSVDSCELAYEALFHDTSEATPVAGQKETVNAITIAKLRKHHQTFYRLNNAHLCIATSLSLDQVKTFLDKTIAELPSDHTYEVPPIDRSEDRQITYERGSVKTFKRSSSSINFDLNFLLAKRSFKKFDLLCLEVLRYVFFDSEASYLFGRARKNGLVYSLLDSVDFQDYYSLLTFSSDVPKDKFKEFLSFLTESLRNQNNIDEYVSDELLELSKNRIMFEMERLLDKEGVVLDYVLAEEKHRMGVSPQYILLNVKAVTKRDLKRILQKVVDSSRVAVIIGGSKLTKQKMMTKDFLTRLRTCH